MSRNKFPKFLLATNEAALPGAAFIIHTRPPLIVAQVATFHTHEEAEEFVRTNKAPYGKPYGYPVVIVYLGELDARQIPETQEAYDELAGLMRRMSDWYLYNYLKKEG